jgi:hypothetical protein
LTLINHHFDLRAARCPAGRPAAKRSPQTIMRRDSMELLVVLVGLHGKIQIEVICVFEMGISYQHDIILISGPFAPQRSQYSLNQTELTTNAPHFHPTKQAESTIHDNKAYICTDLRPDFLLNDRNQAPPDSRCLGGLYSWQICQIGYI